MIGKDDALEFVRDLVGQFEILDLTSSIIEGTLSNKVDDFEDDILIESAKVNNIDLIITRNTKDFISKGVLVMEPKELIDKLGE